LKKYKSQTQKQQGLTLIELLVTMVILGMVISTLSGALSQISGMIRISSEQSAGFLTRWTQQRALYDILTNMVLDPTQVPPFQGSPNQLQLTSLNTPKQTTSAPKRLKVELQLNPQNNTQTLLTWQDVSDTERLTNKQQTSAIAIFNAGAEFRYLDQNQIQHQQWPPLSQGKVNQLPHAVLIIDPKQRTALIRISAHMGMVNPESNAGTLLRGMQ
jgi:prepilin-type N-terminal cleavage/methylation domain-containing protein